MNREELENLGKNAGAWAKAYTRIKEELMREGVPEEEAIQTARSMATAALMKPKDFAKDFADLLDKLDGKEPWEE